MTILLLEIVVLGVGIAIAVGAMAWDRRSGARDQATGCRTEGPRPCARPPEPLAAWVDDAVLRALEEL